MCSPKASPGSVRDGSNLLGVAVVDWKRSRRTWVDELVIDPDAEVVVSHRWMFARGQAAWFALALTDGTLHRLSGVHAEAPLAVVRSRLDVH